MWKFNTRLIDLRLKNTRIEFNYSRAISSNIDITGYVENDVRYIRKSHPTRWRIRAWDRDSVFSARSETEGGAFLYAAAFGAAAVVDPRSNPESSRAVLAQKVADVRECTTRCRKCAHIRLPNCWSDELLLFFLPLLLLPLG